MLSALVFMHRHLGAIEKPSVRVTQTRIRKKLFFHTVEEESSGGRLG